MSPNGARWAKIKTWGLRLVEFGAVQAGVQLLTAVSGFLLVRTMAKHDYALFAIVNSLQNTGSSLADLGIGMGLRSIGGRVWQDRERFGSLLNTALLLRRRFAVASLSVVSPLAVWMLWRNGASPLMILGLVLCIVAATIPLLSSHVWVVVPGLRAEYRLIQRIDLRVALIRFTLIGISVFTWANAFSVGLIGAFVNWLKNQRLRKIAVPNVNETAAVNLQDRQEMIRLSIKSLPNSIFYCFQGQVTLLVLTLAGNRTGIADITALGRIAMLFAIYSVTFSSVLSPRFMRCQDPQRMKRMYLQLCGFTLLVISPFILLSLYYPSPLLWMLGNKYSDLSRECFLVMAAGGVSQLATAMWILNSSKAWIRLQAPALIPTVLSVQVILALCLHLRQLHDVLIFNLISSAAPIAIYSIDAYLGLKSTKVNSIKLSP